MRKETVPDRAAVLRELGRCFRPEFLNRLDRIVLFRPLAEEIAVKIAQHIAPDNYDLAVVAAVAAILGHVFPIWLGFRGGKGVASALGVFLALSPAAAGCTFAIFLVIFLLTRYVSLASIIGSITALQTADFAQASRVREELIVKLEALGDAAAGGTMAMEGWVNGAGRLGIDAGPEGGARFTAGAEGSGTDAGGTGGGRSVNI